MLIGLLGKGIDRRLMLYAAKHTPSLVIDCANRADPHSIYPLASIEDMSKIYVIELELLYKLRDVLLKVPTIIKEKQIRSTIITTSDHLFHYQDERENKDILEHSWELMRSIGRNNLVLVAITSSHLRYAKRYCDRLGVVKNGPYCIKPAHDSR